MEKRNTTRPSSFQAKVQTRSSVMIWSITAHSRKTIQTRCSSFTEQMACWFISWFRLSTASVPVAIVLSDALE